MTRLQELRRSVTISTHVPAETAFDRDETQSVETIMNALTHIPHPTEDARQKQPPPRDADLRGGAKRYVLFEALCGRYQSSKHSQ